MTQILEHISFGISICSLAVIIYGVAVTLILFVRNEFSGGRDEGIRRLRVGFGSYLLLGLELLIAADVIKTVTEPSYQELIILGGIVVLRTILSVFLNKEIKEIGGN